MPKIKINKDNLSKINSTLSNPTFLGSQFNQSNLSKIYPQQNNILNQLPIDDTRNIDLITNKQIEKKAPILADINIMKNIVNAAKRNGIDPYTALAMAYQETGLSKDWGDNPFHMIGMQSEDPFNESMNFLKEKIAYGKKLGKKNEADLIQAWNGYGKITPKSEYNTNYYYGIDVSKNPINMNENPVYGKRVLDIRDNILKKNKDVVNIVNNTM